MRFSRLARLDIFPEKLLPAFTTNYADSVHERSHPKAEALAGRAGVIVCPGPRSARSRYLLFFLVNRTSQKSHSTADLYTATTSPSQRLNRT
ncbi:unnamed protein product [Pieris brassicae]|uniref:Uncharacterized protein n=1 Tax=Pieris brassicae TaxID=7116 RepID=A0A9P0TRX7_PIEBR|nr:unnamed protein product [Pieris brassicae]